MNLKEIYKKETKLPIYDNTLKGSTFYLNKYINWLEEKINYTRCCEELKKGAEKDAFDNGYKKGWEVGISVKD